MKNIFLLYYENDSRVLFFPKDEEMSGLQYIVLRYLQKGEMPLFLSDGSGKCYQQELSEEVLQDLKLWYYSLHPKHRWEFRRTEALAILEEKTINKLNIVL